MKDVRKRRFFTGQNLSGARVDYPKLHRRNMSYREGFLLATVALATRECGRQPC